MKLSIVIFLIVFLTVSLVSVLQIKAEPTTSQAGWSLCKEVETFARKVMKYRQAGGSMSALINTVPQNDKFREVWIDIIVAAYELPLFHTNEYKKRMVNKFANEAYLECVQILRRK